jgi:hypothetical protein
MEHQGECIHERAAQKRESRPMEGGQQPPPQPYQEGPHRAVKRARGTPLELKVVEPAGRAAETTLEDGGGQEAIGSTACGRSRSARKKLLNPK